MDIYNQNQIQKHIFNGVTSFQELNLMGVKMENTYDFNEDDLVQGNMDFWNFKEEKETVGIFKRWEDDNYGQHAVIEVQEEELSLPNLMALNGKLKKGQVKEESKVKIVYKGQQKSKSGRLYEDFDVYIKNI